MKKIKVAFWVFILLFAAYSFIFIREDGIETSGDAQADVRVILQDCDDVELSEGQMEIAVEKAAELGLSPWHNEDGTFNKFIESELGCRLTGDVATSTEKVVS